MKFCVSCSPFARSGFRVWGIGSRVHGAGFKVQGSGFRVLGSEFRVQGSWNGVQISGVLLADCACGAQRLGCKDQDIGNMV